MQGTSIRRKVVDFLQSHRTMVLCYVGDNGLPLCAPVTYHVDRDFIFYFTTPVPSQKYAALKRHKLVSAVIYDDQREPVSISFEGRVEEVRDPGRSLKIAMNVVEKLWQTTPFMPTSFRFKKDRLATMCIRPATLRWFRDDLQSGQLEREELPVRHPVMPSRSQAGTSRGYAIVPGRVF